MATPELAIAKASLSAILFRKEPTSLTRTDIEAFHASLNDAITQCSPANVQKCKRWVLKNLVPSAGRVAALGKYLLALSNSFSGEASSKPSARRKRLHILYVLNDVLFHVTVRDRESSFAETLESTLPGLVISAASFPNCPKQRRKLEDLVELWDKERYFPSSFTSKLRDTIEHAPNSGVSANDKQQDLQGQSALGTSAKSAKEAPFMIPSIHGDPSTPWYDLPAGNWLPHLTPNSTKAMNPDMIKPLQFVAGPADKSLAKAVKDLLTDVERLYCKERKSDDEQLTSLNEMGERIILDEITGEVIGGETYYGWSRAFCDKMKQRKRKAKFGHRGGRAGSSASSRSRSASRDRSTRSPSPPAFKRRRRLSPDSRSPSRSLSRSRSRDRRYSPEPRGRPRSFSRSVSRSPPRHRSRSRSGDRGFRRSRGRGASNRSSRSPIPPGPHQGPPFSDRNGTGRAPLIAQPPPQQFQAPPQFPQFPPPPPPPTGGFAQFQRAQPPPPPPNYQGQWPPPPPPPPMGGGPPQGWYPGPGAAGHGMPSIPPPPPPPPMGGWQQPPPQQNQYQQYGRGNSNYRGRGGRGGYDRGRGGW